jgi:hypothetical protein
MQHGLSLEMFGVMQHGFTYFRVTYKGKLSSIIKGPMRAIFVDEFFTESNPVWVGDSGTGKLQKICLKFGPDIRHFLFLA